MPALDPPPCPETETVPIEDARGVVTLRRLVAEAIRQRLVSTEDAAEAMHFLDSHSVPS